MVSDQRLYNNESGTRRRVPRVEKGVVREHHLLKKPNPSLFIKGGTTKEGKKS
jgi:hypothetical protein